MITQIHNFRTSSVIQNTNTQRINSYPQFFLTILTPSFKGAKSHLAHKITYYFVNMQLFHFPFFIFYRVNGWKGWHPSSDKKPKAQT